MNELSEMNLPIEIILRHFLLFCSVCQSLEIHTDEVSGMNLSL